MISDYCNLTVIAAAIAGFKNRKFGGHRLYWQHKDWDLA
jgi:hypothetical protein